MPLGRTGPEQLLGGSHVRAPLRDSAARDDISRTRPKIILTPIPPPDTFSPTLLLLDLYLERAHVHHHEFLPRRHAEVFRQGLSDIIVPIQIAIVRR